jgi:hypothetical protein
MSSEKALTLFFHDGQSATAIALDRGQATVTTFGRDGSVVLGQQRVPPGLIQFVQSPNRSMRLGFAPKNGIDTVLVFDELMDFGYALNLSAPARSGWLEVPGGIHTAELRGEVVPCIVQNQDGIDAGRSS